MKIRLLLGAAVVVLAANAASPPGNKLSTEQKIVHVLDRLSFGARPGDFEQVRRLGVEKWIELQLHPERIPENPALEARLKPLDTLRMETAEIFTKYFPQFPPGFMPPVRLNELLPGEQFRKSPQRHGGGTARCHYVARPGETHEGARCRSTKCSGRPAGPSEGTGSRAPESPGRPPDGNAAHAAAAQRTVVSATGAGSAARNTGPANRSLLHPGCRETPEAGRLSAPRRACRPARIAADGRDVALAAAGGDRRSARSQTLPRARFEPAVGTGPGRFLV